MLSVQQFRLARLKDAMNQVGADILIAAAPEHIRYLTGWAALGPTYHTKTQDYAVYAPALNRFYIINPMSDAPTAVDNAPQNSDFLFYGSFRFAYPDEKSAYAKAFEQKAEITASVTDSLIEALCRAGAKGCRVAWDEFRTPGSTWNKVAAAFPETEFIPALSIFEQARMIKHPEEIECLRKASNIAEVSLLAALDVTRLGDSEFDIDCVYRQEVARRNARTLFDTCTIDRRSSYSDTLCTKTQRVRDGSIIRFDYGAVYNHFCSDLARTVVVGRADPRLEAEYAAIREGVETAVAMMRPGVLACEVFQAAQDAVQRTLPTFRRHHCGHGIGIMINDRPSISPGDKTVLEAGMVFSIETPYYVLDEYGIQLEDMVEVTANGAQCLACTSNDLIRIPART